jgi:hypothetical protein
MWEDDICAMAAVTFFTAVMLVVAFFVMGYG